jgi:flagellar hook assembly protein FlgD
MLAKGTWTFTWDGNLSTGTKAGPGSYWVEVQSDKTVLHKEIKIEQKESGDSRPSI